ncbi:MAG: phenylalanine--tRNA ligase subunit alpha, partial [Magnetovibrio sp.]|nr:phenylalanine--tRNA ligase subunit alpha [Magnetovibrio sp.]
MMDDPEAIQSKILEVTAAATTLDQLEAIRVEELGKKGRITGFMKQLGSLDPERRKTVGLALNALKTKVATPIEERKRDLADAGIDARLMA